MTIIENIQQKASLLNQLKTDEKALFEYINSNHENLDEVITQYKPEKEFKPVNTLRFLIANEIQKGILVNKALIEDLKDSLEKRDVSEYYEFDDEVKGSLSNYKDSKIGMFPNWKQNFKILFPFIHSNAENEEVKKQLNELADDIISHNQLENVTKHIVSFQGSNNYGTDWVWMAIIPDSSPSVQYAYQIFINIDKKGLIGGIHKGHNLTKQQYNNQDISFNTWDNYLHHTKQIKEQWRELNSKIDFIFINDEKEFTKRINNMDPESLHVYFMILDTLKNDLQLLDEENLVFSTSSGYLNFHVGKRICLSLKKDKFRFITSDSYILRDFPKENFTAPENAFLYGEANADQVVEHYHAIKDAVESEIERDNHTEAKPYDNSAFRKALFDKLYRVKFIEDLNNNVIILNGQKVFKISMGKDYFNDELIEKAIDEKLVLVHSQTKPKGRSDTSQAEIFTKQMKIGDYFYLTHSNKNLKLIGRITSVSQPASFNDMYDDGWLERSFEPLFPSQKLGGFNGSGKYWLPNTNTTCWSINEEELQEANEKLFKPYFDVEFKKNDMEAKFEEFLKSRVKEGTVKTYLSAMRSIEKLAKDEGFLTKSIYQYRNFNEFQGFYERINQSEEYKTANAKQHNRLSAALSKYEEFLNTLNDQKQNSSTESKASNEYNAPLNQIFYGPPGTGKTYSTILEAGKIITRDTELNYADALELFNERLGDQVEFITFHQNYSYEDFIQGLRPDTESSGELSFFRSDGVFKRISDRALKNYKSSNTEVKKKKPFSQVFEEFIYPLVEGDVNEIEIEMNKVSYYITNIRDKSIEFKKASGGTGHTLNIDKLEEMYNAESTDVIRGLIYYYRPLLYKLIQLGKLDETDHVPKKNFVIIIDEINRANISRVFGELITLLEKDKRYGAEIPLTATLPSGESFILPPNLYVVGTMNTADKSIALLDIALRRRFEFVPMYPEYELEGDGLIIHDSDILRKINEAIISRKNHDFTIGHSYFMGNDYDLKNTMDKKVIPLLLEYFMNNPEDVKEILRAADIKVDNWPLKIVIND